MASSKHYRGGQKKSISDKNYYIDGSAVRKLEPEPRRTREHQRPTARPTKRPMARPAHPVEQQSRKKQSVTDKKRQVNQKIAMRNREKALKIDLKYTLFLCTAVVAVLASCVVYLSMQTKIAQKSTSIASLRSELTTLVDVNSVLQERINDSIDLEYVRKHATEVLGMVYPEENQIVEYQSSVEDYVKQYQDIPQSSN